MIPGKTTSSNWNIWIEAIHTTMVWLFSFPCEDCFCCPMSACALMALHWFLFWWLSYGDKHIRVYAFNEPISFLWAILGTNNRINSNQLWLRGWKRRRNLPILKIRMHISIVPFILSMMTAGSRLRHARSPTNRIKAEGFISSTDRNHWHSEHARVKFLVFILCTKKKKKN